MIIEFSPEETKYLSKHQILEIGHYIAGNEFTGYVTYFAVHDHIDNPHIDMLHTENKHQYLEDKYEYSLLPLFSMENAKDLRYSV